jgi:hypothetical protein
MKYSTHFGVVLLTNSHTTDVTVAIGIKCLRHYYLQFNRSRAGFFFGLYPKKEKAPGADFRGHNFLSIVTFYLSI